MKKSRIIIPALAMIAFSMAASISGAVAWFTAQRTASIDAGTYAVIKTTSGLSASVSSGVGTTASGTTVTVDGLLTDGSFDHKQKNIYTPNSSGTALATQPKGQISLTDSELEDRLTRGTNGDGQDAKVVYTAVTFDLTFTITFGSANNDIALLMDKSSDSMTNFALGPTSGTEAKTAKGFRMAFVSNSVGEGTNAVNNGETKVLADLQEFGNCKYVNGTTAAAFSGAAYDPDDLDLIDITDTAAIPTESQDADDLEARVDYMGYFDHTKQNSDHEVSLNYTVVCWFEGTDPEIRNRDAADFQAVVATLCFEVVDINE